MAHSDKAALRGEPSYVWRAGQERRLDMVIHWAKLDGARVLDAGGGNGTYAAQIQRRFAAEVHLFEIEAERVREALENGITTSVIAAAEWLPYASNYFDTIISNEVIEHVNDDRRAASEMLRILKPGGRLVLFCPNRWYPFETHGHYWRGTYHFGNTPLINYLPDPLRNQLAPHVRAYTARGVRALFAEQSASVVHHERIYGGYDNLIQRLGGPMQHVRDGLHRLEGTVLDTWGLSHLLVVEKLQ